MRLRFNGIGRPIGKHAEILDAIFKGSDDGLTRKIDVICGRGFGKSILAVLVAVRALSRGPRERGLFLEPDWNRINGVFLDYWKAIVPPQLYTLNKGERVITWYNGAMLRYRPRNVTGSYAATDKGQVGLSTSFVIDDEAAIRCSREFYTNTLGTVRLPSDSRFYLTISTPEIGEYQALVEGDGHERYIGTSFDNPYREVGYVRGLLAEMSDQQAAREIYARFVALKGRIWPGANLKDPWPDGNIADDWPSFQPGAPWWLFCDLGSSTGSYLVVQKTDGTHNGKLLYPEPRWVAVADYCPSDDASATRAFARLKAEFGNPVAVVGGADLNTRSTVTGETVVYFVRQVFDSAVHVLPVDEHFASKQIQYDSATYLVRTSLGVRRFCIARDFISLDTQSRRGLREMFEQDEWPPIEQRRSSDFLPKQSSNRVQHIRDAFLMGSVAVMRPPRWAGNRGDHAA